MSDHKYDIVGVGFGPSNLALAVAIKEHNDLNPSQPVNAIFFESKQEFAWHSNMMLPDSNMQIAFPKDLATFRNPRSRYTFFNYLYEKGRLSQFINLKTFYPSRIEFADYLKWAADKIQGEVRYSSQVVEIEFSEGMLKVFYRDKHNHPGVIEGRNVVLGLGLTPKVPPEIKVSQRVFHNYNILENIKNVASFRHKKVAILGAGQSAAEVITYFYKEFPETEIHIIFSRFGLTPSDSTSYNNKIFDADIVDDWYRTSPDIRSSLFNYHKATNYSVVDEDLINKIYRLDYQDLVKGTKRIFMHNVSQLLSCQDHEDGVNLKIEQQLCHKELELEVDVLVCCTGFSSPDIKTILKNSDQYQFENGLPLASRNYQLLLQPNNESCPIYLNGCTEHLYGFSSTLLSVTSVRAGEILASILGGN